MTESIPVYSHLYADYGCIASLMLTFTAHETEFKVDAIPAHSAYYRCNEHGIAVYDENFRIVHVAPIQSYFLHSYETGRKLERFFLMHVHDSNLLRRIEDAKMTPLKTENSMALSREAVLGY